LEISWIYGDVQLGIIGIQMMVEALLLDKMAQWSGVHNEK